MRAETAMVNVRVKWQFSLVSKFISQSDWAHDVWGESSSTVKYSSPDHRLRIRDYRFQNSLKFVKIRWTIDRTVSDDYNCKSLLLSLTQYSYRLTVYKL